MAMGDIRDLVAKLVHLDTRLRELEGKMSALEDRVDVIEDNSISYENR